MEHSATRALNLLKAMNRRPVSTVRDLAAETGISKPSVVRLLAILMEDGYVQRSQKTGSYMLDRNVLKLTAGFREDSLVERAAGPPMEKFTASTGWPTALGMLEQGTMVVRYSTIPTSSLSWYRTTLHHRLALLGSAMGLVFLAFSERNARAALLSSALPEATGSFERWEERFDKIRTSGYAIRNPTTEHPTRSLSVPVLHANRVVAGLSVTLFGRAMSADSAAQRYAGKLHDAASAIISRRSLLDDPV
jgi:IclR family mhp operon transcriptional activator